MSHKSLFGIIFVIICTIFGCQATPTQPMLLTETDLQTVNLPPSSTVFPTVFTNDFPTSTKQPTATAFLKHTKTIAPPPTVATLPPDISHQSAPISGSGGGVIAFTSDRDGNKEIYKLYADTSEYRRLTDHPLSDTSPVWSPDGTMIAFVSSRDQNRNIYIMNSDGSNLRQLTNHPSDDMNPVWSPDGTRIGFVSLRDGNAEIYQLTLEGRDIERLTMNSYDDWEFEWSPDGTQIAISSQRTGYANIYIMNEDNSGKLQQLTDTEAHEVYPRWSPDGSQIAFASNQDDNWEIYIMNRDGSNQRRLTNSDENEGPPSWSPDGTQLIFESGPSGAKSIYILNIKNGEIRQLTDDGTNDWEPAWKYKPLETVVSTAAQLVVDVPSGKPPVIDGKISPGEWDDAVAETLLDGSKIMLLQSDNYLFLAIRANTKDMIVGNVFINQGNEVAIMHVSAALGTAVYHRETDTWQQTRDFEWCCRDSSDSSSAQAEREAFRQHENWMSVNSRMGTPNELEYQIAIGGDPIRLAVNYLLVSSNPNDEKFAWPPNLDDDVIKPTPGGLPMQLFFSLDKWGRIDL